MVLAERGQPLLARHAPARNGVLPTITGAVASKFADDDKRLSK